MDGPSHPTDQCLSKKRSSSDRGTISAARSLAIWGKVCSGLIRKGRRSGVLYQILSLRSFLLKQGVRARSVRFQPSNLQHDRCEKPPFMILQAHPSSLLTPYIDLDETNTEEHGRVFF